MKAFAIKSFGGVEVLELLDVEKPKPAGRDLLVKLVAVAFNPVDAKVRGGKKDGAPPAQPKILGFDGAGVVEEVGDGVTEYKKGDEVYFAGSIARQGCHAEFVVIDERIVGKKPKKLSWEEAAAMPLTTLTAWEAIVEGMHVPIPPWIGANPNKNKSILIVAGAGGVGSIAIQIAKRILKIGQVIATASRPETIEWCKSLGADLVINHRNGLKAELDANKITGVDYVFDCVDVNTNFEDVVKCTNPVGVIAGITGFNGVDPSLLFQKRITLVPEMMFTRAMFAVEMEKQKEILDNMADWLDNGTVRHTAKASVPWTLEGVRKAHTDVAAGTLIGKISATVKF